MGMEQLAILVILAKGGWLNGIIGHVDREKRGGKKKKDQVPQVQFMVRRLESYSNILHYV